MSAKTITWGKLVDNLGTCARTYDALHFSSLPEHCKIFKQQIKLENVKILATEDYKNKCRVKEATLTKKNSVNPALNRDGDLDLPLVCND